MASAAVVQDCGAMENPATTLETDAVGAVCSEVPHIDPKELTLIDEKSIGSGGEADVYLYKWRGRHAAVKKIRKSANWSDWEVKQFRESNCLRQLHHENIIVIYGYSRIPELCLVLEYAAGGTLMKVLKEHYSSMTQDVHVVWATQVARGLKYLQEHEESFVHRDLKSNNILVMEPIHISDDLTKKTLKISDFGLVAQNFVCTRISSDHSSAAPWTAPELMDTYDPRLSKKSDVWSFGVVLHEIAYGRVPKIRDKVRFIAEEGLFKSLVEGCLVYNHNDRPEIKKVCGYLESILPPTQPRVTFEDFKRNNALVAILLRDKYLSKIPDKHLQECDQIGKLDLSRNQAIFLDDRLGWFKNLRTLLLEDCGLHSVPSAISKLTQLEELDLSRNVFSDGLQPSFSELQRLKKLVLKFCRLTSVPEWFGLLKALEYVVLSRNDFSTGLNPAIGQLQQLKTLVLKACCLHSVPEWFNQLIQLRSLVLADNDLQDFPTCLNDLPCLKELDLSNEEKPYADKQQNRIRRLPGNFDFTCLRSLNLEGNPVTEPPEEIWKQGPEAIRSFMRACGTVRGEQFLSGVVSVIGDACPGKTSVAMSIARASCPTTETDRTHVMQPLRMAINDLGHAVIVVDDGGLTLSRNLMECFLPKDGVVVIVFDMTKAIEEQRQSIEKWLLAAISKLGKSRVVIVGTHADELLLTSERLTLEQETAELSKRLLKKASLEVRFDIGYMASLSNDPVMSEKLNKLHMLLSNIESALETMRIVTVSCSVPGDGFSMLHNIVAEMQSPHLFPSHWCKAMSEILNLNPSGFYVEISEVRKIAKVHFTEEDDDKSLITILRYLAETSLIIWVENHPYLTKLIFHLPLKIIDACKDLLLNESKILRELHKEDWKAYENGIVRESLLQKVLDEQLKVSSEGSQDQLPQSALDFQVAVDLMEHFNLIKIVPTRNPERTFIIPCKLPAYEPEMVKVKRCKETATTISQNRIKVRLSFQRLMGRTSLMETGLTEMLAVALRLSFCSILPWKGGLFVFHDGVNFLAKLNERKGCIMLTAWCKPPAQSPWTVLQPMLQSLSELAVTSSGPTPLCSVACPHCVGRRQTRENWEERWEKPKEGEIPADLRQLAGLTRLEDAVMLTCKTCLKFVYFPPSTQGGALVGGDTQGTSTRSMPSRDLSDMDAMQMREQFMRNYASLILRLTRAEVSFAAKVLWEQRMLVNVEREHVVAVTKTSTEAAATLIDIIMKRNLTGLYIAFVEILCMLGRYDLADVLTTLRQ